MKEQRDSTDVFSTDLTDTLPETNSLESMKESLIMLKDKLADKRAEAGRGEDLMVRIQGENGAAIQVINNYCHGKMLFLLLL